MNRRWPQPAGPARDPRLPGQPVHTSLQRHILDLTPLRAFHRVPSNVDVRADAPVADEPPPRAAVQMIESAAESETGTRTTLEAAARASRLLTRTGKSKLRILSHPGIRTEEPNKVHIAGRERLIKELVPDDIEPPPPLTEEELFLDEIRLILGCHLADDTARALIEQVRELGIVVHASLYLRTKIDQKLSSYLRKHKKCSIEELVEIISPSGNGQVKPSSNGQVKPSANGQVKAEPPAPEVADESFYKIDLEEIWRNAKDE